METYPCTGRDEPIHWISRLLAEATTEASAIAGWLHTLAVDSPARCGLVA
jgi:hypothetical protein